MVYIPFLWFLFFTFWLWNKHKRIDICVYMSALYAFTSFCAVLIVELNFLGAGGILFEKETLELNLLPTLLYCILLTISILPFSRIYMSSIETITLPSTRLFDYFVAFLFLLALINLYTIIDSTFDILKGDIQEIRSSHYAGEDTIASQKLKSLPSIVGYIYYFKYATIISLPMYFYSICFLNKSFWYNLLLLFISLTIPLSAVQTVDRTEFVFYAQMFIFSFFLFKKFIGKPQYKQLKLVFIPLAFMFIVYIAMVTIARFGEKDSGAWGGALQYAGQGYLNFCYFYENANSNVHYTDRMFPLYNHVVNGIDSTPELRDEKSMYHGFFISVFATFIGDFLLDVGVIGTMVWVALFFILCIVFFPRSTDTVVSLGQIFFVFIMGVVPVFGIFYYRYYHYHNTLVMILLCLFAFGFHYKFKCKG